ncbi:hypothetical protein [Floccifex sp.]|uniref:hypothetical protein n=1 Tax=Floccifex sp. TaxID=2815810 RepID=UPI003F087744
MKRIVKYLIPCLVACFMVFGLVQTASFTFATGNGDISTEEQNSSESENGEGQQSEEPSGQGGSEVGEDLEDVEETKVTTTQPSNQLKKKKPGSGVDTYDVNLDPYESFIKVSKNFQGINESVILKKLASTFVINVSNFSSTYNLKLGEGSDFAPVHTDGTTQWDWIIANTGSNTYSISESGENITGYNVNRTIKLANDTEPNSWDGNSKEITVVKKTLTFGNLNNPNDNKEKRFSVSDSNHIMAFANTQGGHPVVSVISYRKLPYSTQLAVSEYIYNTRKGNWKYDESDPLKGIKFFSLEELNSQTGSDGSVHVNLSVGTSFTYYENPSDGINVDFGSSNITGHMSFDFSYVGGQDEDVLITNTYTKVISVEKQWFDANGNQITDSYPEESVTVALGKIVDGNWQEIDNSRITLSSSQEPDKNWKGSWEVPIIDVNGNPIQYIVRELDASEKPIESNGAYGATNNTYTVNYIPTDVDNDSTTGYESFVVKNTISTIEITIKKDVIGNGANLSDQFTFTYVVKDIDGDGNEIELEKGDFTLIDKDTKKTEENKSLLSKTLTVPIGKTIEITETNVYGYTLSSDKGKVDGMSVEYTVTADENQIITLLNTKNIAPITGITDNTPKGLGMIGTIVAEVAAIAFVLKKKKQLKM